MPFALLLLLTAATTAVANAQAPQPAMQVAAAYSAALNANDCATVLRLVSPALTRRLDSTPEGRRTLCEQVGELAAAGVHDRLRAPTASLSGGPYRLVAVPNSRTGLDPDTHVPTITTGTYYVHSSDSGKTWHVLDLGCVDERWVREVFPPYAGVPKVQGASLEVLAR